MESDYLIDCNRPALKELFFSHLAANESPFVSFNQFISFCVKLKLYPELVSLSELKRILLQVLKKSLLDDKQLEINYLQFEKLLRTLSDHCFPSGNSLKLLISHIKSPCKHLYSILLTTVAPIQPIHESSKLTRGLNTTRNKNISMTQRKILNTSASQKISTTKVEQIKSPRDKTLLSLKILKNNGSGLRIINLQNKMKDERKVERVGKVYGRFIRTHKAIMSAKRTKRLLARFVERYVEGKMRVVNDI